MKSDKSVVKISAVSYLNTKPFIYGIENSGFLSASGGKNYRLELDIPSVCADKLLNDEVDLGLIPVVVIPRLQDSRILTDYCIGAVGAVRSVMLFSDVPLKQIKRCFLDCHSETSVLLTKILAGRYWKINPEWFEGKDGFEVNIKGDTAGIVIGDRALNLHDKFQYSYDLAEEWHRFTSLPFVFACWVANKPLPGNFIEAFDKAIEFGVQNKEKAVNTVGLMSNGLSAKDYINNCISYELDAQKQKGMKLFLNYVNKLMN